MLKLTDLVSEAQRQLEVCNACRYCEGYCAVFPALERDSLLTTGRVIYLANLCHDCRACYQACMYTPPHPFNVNVPHALSGVRRASYQQHSPSRVVGAMFRHESATAAVVAFAALSILLAGLSAAGRWDRFQEPHSGPGAFYEVIPFVGMVAPAMFASLIVLAIFWRGFLAFWRNAHGSLSDLTNARLLWAAIKQGVVLTYLRGGGDGCFYPDADRPSQSRRIWHIVLVVGFLLAFLSSTLAAISQEILGSLPPYPLLSPTVVTGTLGGIMMVLGSSILLVIKSYSPRRLTTEDSERSDYAFLAVLDAAALSGLLLLVLRSTPALGWMLAVHLAILTALYFTAPYGKFAHAVYRLGALLLNQVERNNRQLGPAGVGTLASSDANQ